MSIEFDKYQDVINRLVSEAIACSPGTWKKGTLRIDSDGKAINYKLKNDEDESKAEISTALRKLCEELYVVMRNDGSVWTECTVNFFEKEESWGLKVDFQYPASPPLPTASDADFSRVEQEGSTEARGGLIDGVTAYYVRIAKGLISGIRGEWTVAYFDAVFFPGFSDYLGEYVSKTDGKSKSADNLGDAIKAVREMRAKFAEAGKPLWGRFSFKLESDFTIHARWGYEGCGADGNVIYDEAEIARRDLERRKRDARLLGRPLAPPSATK